MLRHVLYTAPVCFGVGHYCGNWLLADRVNCQNLQPTSTVSAVPIGPAEQAMNMQRTLARKLFKMTTDTAAVWGVMIAMVQADSTEFIAERWQDWVRW